MYNDFYAIKHLGTVSVLHSKFALAYFECSINGKGAVLRRNFNEIMLQKKHI